MKMKTCLFMMLVLVSGCIYQLPTPDYEACLKEPNVVWGYRVSFNKYCYDSVWNRINESSLYCQEGEICITNMTTRIAIDEHGCPTVGLGHEDIIHNTFCVEEGTEDVWEDIPLIRWRE